MKGISRYEKIILGLTAAFIALCTALFLSGAGKQDYTITVSDRTPDVILQSESLQPDGTPDSLLPGEKINVNTAPPLDLARLPGIGESRAQAIVDYREANGPFQSVDDLINVSGIGEVTLEKLREYASTDP